MSEMYRVPVDPAATNNPHSAALRLTGAAHRVLEVGCSVGHVTEHLVAAGNTVVGVELDPDAAEQASAWATNVHVLDLDVDRVSAVESGRFDVIMLGDVIEHLRDPLSALGDLVTLLEDDGRLIVSVPNVSHVDIRLMLLEGTWEYQHDGLLDDTHLRWFTNDSLRRLLGQLGFTARRVERIRQGIGASGLPVTPGLHSPDVIRFIESDPEAHTYQFVVEEAVRSASGMIDALESTSPAWPDLRHERAQLEAELEAARSELTRLSEHNLAVQTELEAWQNSKLARLSAPLRSVWGRVSRSRG
jgi:SAM-dependent methyltransferase